MSSLRCSILLVKQTRSVSCDFKASNGNNKNAYVNNFATLCVPENGNSDPDSCHVLDSQAETERKKPNSNSINLGAIVHRKRLQFAYHLQRE
jgi:hypothetical protein